MSTDQVCLDKASLLVEPAFRLCPLRSPEETVAIRPDAACVVLDETISGEHTMDLMIDIRERARGVPIVVCLEHNDVKTAVRYARRGATDCIVKPVDTVELSATFARTFLASSHVAMRDSSDLVAKTGIVGSDPGTRSLRHHVSQVAVADSAVLIQGESGVGKEVVARAIHQLSSRRGEPFVAVNCSAVPDALFESELFGVKRGAYTGATARDGLVVSAQGGTLFLDEIGELRSENQAKLLRVLEERRVTPLGSSHSRPVDVRFLCATNRNLLARARARLFRLDLYYRISAAHVAVRPLRTRPDDIEDLVEHFYTRRKQPTPAITADAWEVLRNHAWPGNVRELFNVLERREIHTPGGQFTVDQVRFEPVWE